MAKKGLLMFLMILPIFMFAQNEGGKKQTKYEMFVSRSGCIKKFVEEKKENCEISFNSYLKGRIRTVYGEAENTYFFILEKEKIGGSIAYIEFSDLVEINKAIKKLSSEVKEDCELKPEYLENFFTSVDGFKIGYYVEKSKATWLIRLEFRGPSYEVKNIEDITNYLSNAQKILEGLKVSNGK